MDYVPNTDAERAKMLAAIGVKGISDLFQVIPEAYRYPQLSLPEPLSEAEMLGELRALSEEDNDLDHYTSFLGAGAYNHFIPSVVDSILSRSEFYTAYTPYQAEISQGWLQAIHEYQTMVCALTGMDVANASHYDGATATAEAVIMALSITRHKRKKVILSPTLHPQHRQVVRTYTQGAGVTVVGDDQPYFDLDTIKALLDNQTSILVWQNPDFLGHLYSKEEMKSLADAVHAQGALFAVAVDPVSLGLFTPPGEYDADIVTAEGQGVGNAISFGGPYLGIFAFKKKYVHKSSGRIVGATEDAQGRKGYALTLSGREQHIRRERASSNICSNQALNALATAVYLAAMGKNGLKQVANLSYQKAHYAAQQLMAIPGVEVITPSPFFLEFAIRSPRPAAKLNRYLWDEWGIIGGYDLQTEYHQLGNALLLSFTEMTDRVEIDDLVMAVATFAGEEAVL